MTNIPMAEADPEDVGLSSLGLARIDNALQAVIDAKQLPGAVVLVARDGKIVHRAVLGLKNIDDQEPLAFDTIFRIFSMTKPVTAVAMMAMYDRGLWSPDDPISKHLPEFQGVKGPDGATPEHAPTLHELMTHTAGFGYGIGPGPHDPVDQSYIDAKIWQAADLADFSRRVAALPLAYQPGSRWRYSLSMDLQGAIIEKLSGQTLPDFMRTTIFKPLGMVDTDFFVPEAKLARLATPYHMYFVSELTVLDYPGFIRDPLKIPSVPSGGGGLYSTATDYSRFAQMLLNKGELDGTRVISPGAVEMMTSNQISESLIGTGFIAGTQKIGPGRGYGFNGAVFFDPEAAVSPVGRGTYQWDGAGGTWFWIDPQHRLLFVGMIQRMLQDGMPRLQEITQQLLTDAMETR